MAYEELLDWARGRPPWQQDALRRLALHGELTTDDLAALQLHIQQVAGFPAVNMPEPVPFSALPRDYNQSIPPDERFIAQCCPWIL